MKADPKMGAILSPGDIALAQQSSRNLAAFSGQKLTVSVGDTSIALPAPAAEMLVKMLTEMGEGNAVTLVPVRAQITTEQAAHFLGVSRPFVIKQLKTGKLPFQKVGSHRRIAFADLLKFRQEMQKESNAAMDELLAQAQELDMGY